MKNKSDVIRNSIIAFFLLRKSILNLNKQYKREPAANESILQKVF